MVQKRRTKHEDKSMSFIVHHYPESPVSEQYKAIRTNIHFSPNGQACKTLLITTPDSKERNTGHSAVNLAISMIQGKQRVLLIDANFKNPSFHSTFQLTNELGLADVLLGKSNIEETIQNTQIGRLQVLTSGQLPYTTTELFSLNTWKKIKETKLSQYDRVLIYAPSLLQTTEVKLLANQCDGVVLIVSPRKTKLERAVEAKKTLKFAHANVVGVILNEQ